MVLCGITVQKHRLVQYHLNSITNLLGGAFSENVLSIILFAGFGTVGIAPDGQGKSNIRTLT